MINKDNSITAAEMSIQIGISESRVKRTLVSLSKKGVIVRVGPKKGGRWDFSNFQKK